MTSSNILKEHDVSETGAVSNLRWMICASPTQYNASYWKLAVI
jgi:hypothetical protein